MQKEQVSTPGSEIYITEIICEFQDYVSRSVFFSVMRKIPLFGKEVEM